MKEEKSLREEEDDSQFSTQEASSFDAPSKKLAMYMRQEMNHVRVIAANDIEIMASCDRDHTYSRFCGNYFLNANEEQLIPMPISANPHMHVRLAKHSGEHHEIGGASPWTKIDIKSTTNAYNHCSSTVMSM
jgi:hypothetical protein